MVIKGRSRSNGTQLADYLLRSKGNDRADVLEVRGTASPDSLKKSLLEMSMSSNLTKRGNKGLYHAQINPAIGEDRPMTPADWIRAAELLEDALGYTGQKRAIVLHEKNGRLHGHVVWERYDHDTGKLRTDSQNFKKHDQAREQIEQELGHERTAQRADRAPTDKEHLANLWQQHPEGSAFVKAAEEAGYYIAQGNARRPFRVVTPDGQSLDLMRQFDGDTKKDVREKLKAIRADLWPEDEALQLAKTHRDQRPAPVPAECHRQTEPPPLYSYGFTVEQPLTVSPAPAPVVVPQRDELSEKQDLAAAMIERFRQKREAGRETIPQQPPETATAQPQPERDQQPQKYYNPVTGQEMTPEAYQRLMERIETQRRQDQERRADRDRGLSIG